MNIRIIRYATHARRRLATTVGLVALLGCLLDAQSVTAQAALDQLEVKLAEGEPIDVSFPEAQFLPEIARALSRAFEVEIAVAPELRTKRLELELVSARLDEVLEVIDRRAGAFHVVQEPRKVLIALDHPRYRRAHEPLVLARYHLRHADLPSAMNTLRALVDVRKVAFDEATRTLTVRDRLPTLQSAARILEGMDQPPPGIELQIDVFSVRAGADLGSLPAIAARADVVDRLARWNGELALTQKHLLQSGGQNRVEISSQLVARDFGWEGLALDTMAQAMGDDAVRLRAKLTGACLRITAGESLRRDERQQSAHADLAVGHSLVAAEALPQVAAADRYADGTCGLLAEPTEQNRSFVVLLTPTVRPAPTHALQIEAWRVGTEAEFSPPGEAKPAPTS